jgi:hypothetical protein
VAQFNYQSPPEPPILRIEPFKGINLAVTPTQIDQAQSPDMLNMNIDERGSLNKRTGYQKVFPRVIGEGQINGIFLFRKTDGSEKFLVAHGEKLYSTTEVDATWEDDELEQTWEV